MRIYLGYPLIYLQFFRHPWVKFFTLIGKNFYFSSCMLPYTPYLKSKSKTITLIYIPVNFHQKIFFYRTYLIYLIVTQSPSYVNTLNQYRNALLR